MYLGAVDIRFLRFRPIKEPFNLQKYIPNVAVATLVFFVLSFVSAEVLKLVSKPITGGLNKLAKKLSKEN